MSETKAAEPVVFTAECVAVQMGFYKNSRVRPGQRFTFTGTRVPRWAAKVGDPLPAPAAKLSADLKPKDAQRASKAKAAGTSNAGDDLA